MTGLRAVATVDGQQLVSEEIEIAVVGDDPIPAPRAGIAVDAAASAMLRGPVPAPMVAAPSRFTAATQRAARFARLSADPPDTAACSGPQPFETVDGMGTVGGAICWLTNQVSGGSLSSQTAVSERLWLAPEGPYYSATTTQSVYFPPDWVRLGYAHGMGCMMAPDEVVRSDFLAQLLPISISMSIGPLKLNQTYFSHPSTGMIRGFQQTVGVGVSLSLIPAPVILGVSVGVESERIAGPISLGGYDGACAAPLLAETGASFARATQNPLVTLDATLAAAEGQSMDTYRAALRRHTATSLRPLIAMLATPTGHGASDDGPAATSADAFAEFFDRSDAALCDDCPSTSIDGIVAEFADRLSASPDTAGLLAAGAWSSGQMRRAMPDTIIQASLYSRARVGVELAFELAADLAAEARGDANRYVADTVVVLDGRVDEPVGLDVTADEIATLTGVDAAAVEGATVTFDGTPVVEEAAFVLQGGVAAASLTPSRAVGALIRVQVDLATAQGPLPAGAEQWVVRPAPRLVQVQAGPPQSAWLTAPASADARAEIPLSATLLDEHFNVVTHEATFTFIADEHTLGQAQTRLGVARMTVTPEVSTPQIDAVEPTTLRFPDGSTGPGLSITGRGFSREATLWVDGEPVDTTVPRTVVDSTTMLVGSLPASAGRLSVVNPEGATSAGVDIPR